MKTFAFKFGILAVSLMMAAGQTDAQQKKYLGDPKYGPDSAAREECAMRMSLYNEFYKQKNYKDAVNDWRKVYQNCPAASKNTFIRGATIYKNLIKAETDNAKKEALIDTLMMIYDQRIVYFKQEGAVLASKGVDLYSYRGKEAAADVYEMLKKSCELEKGETGAGVTTVMMQSAVDQYRAEEVDGAEVISAYELAMATIDLAIASNKQIVAGGDAKKVPAAQKELENLDVDIKNVEALFSESGAATCDALIAIFDAKYDANKDDVEWLKKVTKLLDKAECNSSALFAKSSEALYALEPSAVAARNLARLFYNKKEISKSLEYYSKACELQDDPELKSQYYVESAYIVLGEVKNYPKVRELANNALKANPSMGKAYIVIGLAYASDAQNIGSEKVEHDAAYWAAVDKFTKAKQVDSSCEEEANRHISTYKKYFPNKEEAFMYGIQEGASVTVGGWINEKTTARF
ncbi:MAG: hypothetical protein J6W13_05645 [Salinivirgaceae bacterium]|nr:hypothetical protein [Salinivirgaceae bacterium]